MKKVLYLPLLNGVLTTRQKIDIGYGFTIERLKKSQLEEIAKDDDMTSGLKSSLKRLKITLAYRPTKNHLLTSVVSEKAQYGSFFVGILIRMLSDIPLNMPWWLYYTDSGQGRGKTLIQCYKNEPDYQYILDTPENLSALRYLKNNIENILQRMTRYDDKPSEDERFIRAIETSSFAFQMRHIPPRLVSIVTFQEILFSSSRNEITHQLAERIAWYLEPKSYSARELIYEKCKNIYGARSIVVHGDSHWKKPKDIKMSLLDAETLNGQILLQILKKRNIAEFSSKNNARKSFLKRMALGGCP